MSWRSERHISSSLQLSQAHSEGVSLALTSDKTPSLNRILCRLLAFGLLKVRAGHPGVSSRVWYRCQRWLTRAWHTVVLALSS
jgi:hypothetical protein